MNFSIGQKVIDTEIKALSLMKKTLSKNQFDKAVNIIYKTPGRIIISGIGKSGHIASKIASTFSSIGSTSSFLHPSEANHGDLGMITKKIVLFLFQTQGRLQELTNLILHCKKLKIPIISITSEVDSTLSKESLIYSNYS